MFAPVICAVVTSWRFSNLLHVRLSPCIFSSPGPLFPEQMKWNPSEKKHYTINLRTINSYRYVLVESLFLQYRYNSLPFPQPSQSLLEFHTCEASANHKPIRIDLFPGGWMLSWPIGSASASHQCGLGSIPGWGSDPGAVSKKGLSSPV